MPPTHHPSPRPSPRKCPGLGASGSVRFPRAPDRPRRTGISKFRRGVWTPCGTPSKVHGTRRHGCGCCRTTVRVTALRRVLSPKFYQSFEAARSCPAAGAALQQELGGGSCAASGSYGRYLPLLPPLRDPLPTLRPSPRQLLKRKRWL